MRSSSVQGRAFRSPCRVAAGHTDGWQPAPSAGRNRPLRGESPAPFWRPTLGFPATTLEGCESQRPRCLTLALSGSSLSVGRCPSLRRPRHGQRLLSPQRGCAPAAAEIGGHIAKMVGTQERNVPPPCPLAFSSLGCPFHPSSDRAPGVRRSAQWTATATGSSLRTGRPWPDLARARQPRCADPCAMSPVR